ncbi:MAG TPA: FtsX-like permease family protein, partial [Longimicrobiales bacterium]|nr:FtsX-like permease family protein [Longimicrobiales bacterium]
YDGDAMGRRIAFGSDPENATWRTIVGVAEDVRHFGIRVGTRPAVYFPYGQVQFGSMAVAVRSAGDLDGLVPEVRRTLARADPALAASGIRPLQELVDTALAPDRFVTFLLTVFAGAALLLAAVGIYGVISYGVTRRYREMGIRLALGADAGRVRRLVVRGGLVMAVAGIAVGLAGALALTRVLGSFLFDVTPTDPVTFAGTTALLAAVALLASWLPARRAARADPVTVLRAE